MPPALRLVLRAAWYMTVGAVVLAALGLAMYLPSELGTPPPSASAKASSTAIALGVTLACARLGAVIGLIVFLLRRALAGEIADPRALATRVAEEPPREAAPAER